MIGETESAIGATGAGYTLAQAVQGPELLGEFETMMDAVTAMFASAQAEGALPHDREPPDGQELIVWIGSMAEPMAFATFFDVGHGRFWLDVLYVKPYARRMQLGSSLLRALLVHLAGRDGFRKLMFGTRDREHAMAQMAEGFGARVESMTYAWSLPSADKRENA